MNLMNYCKLTSTHSGAGFLQRLVPARAMRREQPDLKIKIKCISYCIYIYKNKALQNFETCCFYKINKMNKEN